MVLLCITFNLRYAGKSDFFNLSGFLSCCVEQEFEYELVIVNLFLVINYWLIVQYCIDSCLVSCRSLLDNL